MNLYLISQESNNTYDTYDSAVVAAETEEAARMIHPGSILEKTRLADWNGKARDYDSWTDAEQVSVVLLGVAKEGTKAGVICASFNAG